MSNSDGYIAGKFIFSATPKTNLLNLRKLFINLISFICVFEVATIVASNFFLNDSQTKYLNALLDVIAKRLRS